MPTERITTFRTCARVVVLDLELDQSAPFSWRLFDCPHCRKTNASLLKNRIRSVSAARQTTLALTPHCSKCHSEVRVQFTDWDERESVATAPTWICPRCGATNALATVGRITSVDGTTWLGTTPSDIGVKT